jgi:glycosyltransferase involved in cell wall biosynthesis
MDYRVAAFTDTYLPTVNGVSYTLKSWREGWNGNGGRMDVVYPRADGYEPGPGEHPVGSLPFPFYEGFRLGVPRVPEDLTDADVVHVHSPFALGLSGVRMAREERTPVVASYHTPAGEYAGYLGPTQWLTNQIRGLAETYERAFYDRASVLVVPSKAALRHVRAQVGVGTDVRVVSNGVDIDRFRPVDAEDFITRHDLPTDRPLVGYTGRHGYEKNVDELVRAAEGLDATVVLGGDGPAHEDLKAQAAAVDGDVRLLGFLDRKEMPAFYSALDVFAFPSPVETQGLVALEANACGTPVVGVDAGALSDTVKEGVTGYRYPGGDVEAFRDRIRETIAERDRLRERCLDRREAVSVERSLERLGEVYDGVVNDTDIDVDTDARDDRV